MPTDASDIKILGGCPKISNKIAEATKIALAEYTTIYSAEALRRASAEFFGLGWERTYFNNYSSEDLSRHLYGYLCAKSDGSSDRFYFSSLDPVLGGVVVTCARREDLAHVDDMIDREYLSAKFNHGLHCQGRSDGSKKLGVSVRCYYSNVKPSQSTLFKSLANVSPNTALLENGLLMAEKFGLALFIITASPYVCQAVTDCGTIAAVQQKASNNNMTPRQQQISSVLHAPMGSNIDFNNSTFVNARENKPLLGPGITDGDVSMFLGTEYFVSQNSSLGDRGGVVARYGRTLIASSHNVVLSAVSSISHTKSIIATDSEKPVDSIWLQLGFRGLEGGSYFSTLSTLIGQVSKVRFIKKIVETFSNGTHVYTFYIDGATESDVRMATGFIGLLPTRATHHRPIMDLYLARQLSPIESLYATALTIFAFYFAKPRVTEEYNSLQKSLQHQPAALRKLNTLNDSLFREIVQESHITEAIKKHLPLFKAIFAVFEKDQVESTFDSLMEQTNRVVSRTEREIFRTFIRFNASVRRTNLFKENKAAMSFRLDPADFFKELDFPRVPYAVFFIVGSHFRGFHVRFHDIARGGIRIIRTRGPDPEIVSRRYQHNRAMLFQETYNLAYTQMLKNKDIPESGSKGTILVSVRAKADDKNFYLKYVDAVMDLVCDNVKGVIARGAGKSMPKDLLFFGPDEGTAGDFPNLAAIHARQRGFAGWKSFTTGKAPHLGGIPHDEYGCTTRSIRQYALGTYRKLGLEETKLTKFMTGGPDGDLGSNEIKQGKERVIGICDGFASVHDPEGINHEELLRLAENRLNLSHFDKSKLTARGFKVGVLEQNVTLPDGTVVKNGTLFRDNFHFSPYAVADVFIPCGGRPAAVNFENVLGIYKRQIPGVTADAILAAEFSTITVAADGKTKTSTAKPLIDANDLRWKYVIEGANLFFTNEARVVSEKSGVIHFKDASTNKGGVTSSALEVLAGLALSDAEHASDMCVPKPAAPGQPRQVPAFYGGFVNDMLERLSYNAHAEFECIWADSAKGLANGGLKTQITDALSLKILRFKEFVQSSNLSSENAALYHYVVEQYLPKTLRERVPLDVIMKRVPRPYLEAIFSGSIAAGFVYSTGLEGNEFNFFQYMLNLTKKAEAHYNGGKNKSKL